MQPHLPPGNLRRRRLLKAVVFGVAECAVIVAIVLLINASHIRSLPVGKGVEVGLGPVHLLHIEKQAAASGGYSLAFDPHASILVLLGLCLAFEVAIMWRFFQTPAEPDTPGDNT